MNCKYHKESEAKYICDKCKQPICEECSVDVNGNKLCSNCIERSVFSNEGQYYKGGFFESFAFFCFACVPGAAQMYMNLFKRGFQLMFGFIGSIVLFSYVNTEGMIPLVIIPVWFFSFFDSYAVRRRLRRGEVVEDVTIIDYDILFSHKKVTGMVMLVLGILGVANAFEHSVMRDIFGGQLYWAVKRSIVPIALVLAGVYVLGKSKKTNAEEQDTEDDLVV
ncbi:MAG TPA: B-box zinc finger protein [Clostridia bacterium]|nr:B-box zinc finger protein [Clostridia bacterium]